MSSELRAAAQRWIEQCKHPVTQPEWDAVQVSQDYLAQHPEDENEPVTPTWIANTFGGFIIDWNNEEVAGIRLNDETLLLFRRNETLIDVGTTYWECELCKARGDVRRLLTVLGIEVTK